jgi:hypothetical protein
METALGLLRLALERGWTVGLLFVLFCGMALASSVLGTKLPPVVMEWSTAGLIFGVAIILVSWVGKLVGLIRRRLQARAERNAEAAEDAAYARHVLANVAALGVEDAAVLEGILSRGDTRFQVDAQSVAFPLVQMGLLRVVGSVGRDRFICEVHPALRGQLKKITGR